MIRPKLYRALQKALRDVQAYQYEISTAKVFRWIPNDRKAKKHRVEGSGGGSNEEEFIDVEGDDAYIWRVRESALPQSRDSLYEEEVPPEELEAAVNGADQRPDFEW
ncbi:hypothetical protein Aduo_018337 [Ancylostoma duodenale]